MDGEQDDIRTVVREVMAEFFKAERAQVEPAQQAALTEEREKREALERRIEDLVAEGEKAKARVEEAERNAAIRAELQRVGVAKLDLAYKAVKDEIYRSEDGRLLAQSGVDLREHIARFVGENPELLPARLAGGSGASGGLRSAPVETQVDLDKIRPGMNPEELERVRQEIARVASQTLRGW